MPTVAGDVGDRRALGAQRDDPLVAGKPRRMSLLALPLHAAPATVAAAGLGAVTSVSGRLLQHRPLLLQEAFERVAEVLQEVEAVGDLYRRGRTARRAVGVEVAAVARDEGDGRVRAEPCRDRIGGAVGQEIDGSVPFEIAQDGAVAGRFPPRPVVDAQHARRRDRARDGTAHTRRSKVSPLVGIPRVVASRLPASPPSAKPMCASAAAEPVAASSTGRDERGQAFAEGPARAVGGRAEEAAGVDHERDRAPATGQIGDAALVAAVDSMAAPMTERAGRRPCGRRGDEGKAETLGADMVDAQPTELREQGGELHRGLLREAERRCEGV